MTTCSAAQATGIHAAPTPTSLSLSSRNASVELPRLNRNSTARYLENRVPSGAAGTSGAGVAATRGAGASGTGTSIATAINPGMSVSANSVRYCSGKNHRKRLASSGPTMAPA